ncbi:flowering time control protein FPA [Macadamia integrifolia]|uniref:flowering time control protein FPA n=1 Tax=Macadamia integrifolia TaxID=60698 RepID=UPI001C528370|nr:flowering time control protein FPA [Macadamia integrifolia]
MAQIGRGGRDSLRRGYSPRFEEKGYHGRNNNPPSRCLWVGNLSHHVTEKALLEQFLRFGELDGVAFQPGRSYGFITFRNEDDATVAMRGLQGFIVSGMPLKIEFAKAERPLTSTHYEDHQKHRDEERSADRAMPFFERDSRKRHASPEQLYPDKSRMGDKNAEPSEVLWIGFPAFLNVDEIIIRRAFMPFGEIEKVTVFPGRSYAFVRFRSVVAACRAKEALQGKLFNNPRVSICFAKSDTGPSERGRNSLTSLSPHFKSNSHPGQQPSESFRLDRNFGSSTGETHTGSPHFISNLESGDSGVTGLGRNSSLWTGGAGPFEQMRSQAPGSKLGPSEDMYERNRSSSARDRGAMGARRHDFSPDRHSLKSPLFENSWNLTDDAFLFREAKKLKSGTFPPEKELPEYPFSDLEQDKPRGGPRMSPYLPDREAFDKNFESGLLNYKWIPDRAMNLIRAHGEGDDHGRSSFDSFDAGSGSLPNAVKWERLSPELRQSPLNKEWKWEGTIAKGGTPVCRARCFPVGKVMDVMLPEFLNCTARTGLDMLMKHFYQAASVWVVFFVPESDADIAFYDEFMHYLGEKQRAAVAKLGEKTTLFLVPPSDFSEKVLKVPGKMSISGVILRFQYPNSNFGSPHHPLETMDSKLSLLHDDLSYPKSASPDVRSSAWGQSQSYVNSSSEPTPSGTSLSASRKAAGENFPYLRVMAGPASSALLHGPIPSAALLPESLSESRYDQPLQCHNPVFPSNWSHDLRNPNPDAESIPTQISSNSVVQPDDSITQEYHPMKLRVMQESSLGHFSPGISGIPVSGGSKFTQLETKSQPSTSMSIPSLQPEQLAQLSSLLGQKQESRNVPAFSLGEDGKQTVLMNQAAPVRSSQSSNLRNLTSSSPSSSQIGQGQSLQATASAPTIRLTSTEQQIGGTECHGNQPLQSNGAREETEADPQKRLQATLQLAAALLQQIQQQAKTVDQR